MEKKEYSQTGVELTSQFEGLRLNAYQDSGGVWTIGYGHTSGVRAGMICTQVQAKLYLLDDVREAVAAVNKLVKVELNQNQFDALVDFVFNVGQGNFAKSTLLRLLNDGDYAGAQKEFKKWNKAAGVELPGLVRRRAAEAVLFGTAV